MSIVQMRGSTLLEGMRVLGLDLETTGFMPRSDRIVEFALVGSDSDGSRVYLQSVVNPGVKIPPNQVGFTEFMILMLWRNLILEGTLMKS